MELGQRGKIATHHHDITDTGTSRAMIAVGKRQRLPKELGEDVCFLCDVATEMEPEDGLTRLSQLDHDLGNFMPTLRW
jgi:hypothetical protein